MTDQLLSAITPARKWSENFSRYNYRDAFSSYCQTFKPLYINALKETEDSSSLATELLDALEMHWKKLMFWNRSAAKVDEKLVIVSYLSPMLLAENDPVCISFAEELCRQWNQRFPNNQYEMAPYAKIRDGFRHVVMGIDFENKHFDR